MKKIIKTAAVLIAAVLLAGMAATALADDRMYTSPTFKVPKSRISAPLYPENGGEDEAETGTETAGGNGEEPAPETPGGDGTEPAPETDEGPSPEGAGEGTGSAENAGTEPEPEQDTEPVREVRIYSSRGEVVTEGDMIELTSVLIGFDGLEVSYQWQVDRGDGEGWQDVKGATRWRYVFIADKETIRYNWRLIVTADE